MSLYTQTCYSRGQYRPCFLISMAVSLSHGVDMSFSLLRWIFLFMLFCGLEGDALLSVPDTPIKSFSRRQIDMAR